MSRVPAALWKKFIAIQIYGANTGVGKTVFSTLLGAHFNSQVKKSKWRVNYIKPVSTGPMGEADDRYVRKFLGGQDVHTIFQYNEPVSPHIAARDAAHIPGDEELNHRLYASLKTAASLANPAEANMGMGIVETAGGVLSPGPSGTPQADLFRPLRLPAVLVGDHRLGGIASTISATESLIMRGYDVDAVVCFDDGSKYDNATYLKEYFSNRNIPTIAVPWIPCLEGVNEEEEFSRMSSYYKTVSQGKEINLVADQLIEAHAKRLESAESLALRTQDTIWHPFTQHKHIKKADDILVFDSAYGDYFQVKHTSSTLDKEKQSEDAPLWYPAFDGSASWWTQGLGHGNSTLALEAAYAAGRYGHIMFAGATHAPALTLAERVLQGLANPRLKKVFYTDNGSTAAEVGIKMGLRASCKHYEWDGSSEAVGVLGLQGSYHGDTIGAMDASEPCVFNQKVDWYRGRGFWFDYPTFKLKNGRWLVEPPQGMEDDLGPTQVFENMSAIFNLDRRHDSPLYEAYIEKVLDKLVKEEGRKFGALVMEPIILGAGGMRFVDPLFQRSLVRVVRRYDFSTTSIVAPKADTDDYGWTGLPVMFDEVFTGLYRLGRFSSASFLGVRPDISIHAKLLTGGLLPLSITAASQSIFEAFWGDEKSEALLHGHSYTAHPIGCHVANTSLQIMKGLDATDPSWEKYKKNWQGLSMSTTSSNKAGCGEEETRATLWSMWSQEFVLELSQHESIDHVNALGSVLAVSLVDRTGSGYTSSAAIGLRDALLHRSSIHSRVLGNVIYLMASMTSTPEHLAAVEASFMQELNSIA